MKFTLHPINFDLKREMLQELPFTTTFYEQDEQLWNDVKDLMLYPMMNKNAMPFFTFSSEAASRLYMEFQNIYDVMLVALTHLFKEDLDTVKLFYGKSFLEQYPYFWEYAKHTFEQKHPSLYGRFDVAIDPERDSIKGIYEFNGDTPVMLFESVNLQNMYTKQVTGSAAPQFNEYYPLLIDFISRINKNKQFAVICDMDFIEDIVTCETLTQIIEEAHPNGCVFDEIKNLNYDFSSMNRGSSPFYVGSNQLDESEHINVTDIFMLSPWEEIIENDSKQKFSAFKNWKSWTEQVRFYEPAWRWFFSNKGFWAYVTHLQETSKSFYQLSKDLPFLKTYMSPDIFIEQGISYVSKPLIGRLSNNITIYDLSQPNAEPFKSGGVYEGYQCVYQEFSSPSKISGRQNFISCCWMAPVLTSTGGTNSVESQPASFCIREFDKPVLDIANERFIPHLIVD